MVGNIDATVIAQKPKLRPYIGQMEQNVADVLGIAREQVNIKATTEEHLGFTGREEGISAQAVCLLGVFLRWQRCGCRFRGRLCRMRRVPENRRRVLTKSGILHRIWEDKSEERKE